MQELLAALNIKPGAILVNIVGFLIVFWVLRKLLYGPVGRVLQAREEAVRGNLAQAAHARAIAERDEEQLAQRLAQIEREQRDAIQQATAQANQAAEEILQTARAEAEGLVRRAQEQITHEKEKALVELREQVVDLAVDSCEAILRRTLDDQRHRVIVDEFLRDLEAQRGAAAPR